MGSITAVYVSNNEILVRGKFDYQNKIDQHHNYLEEYKFIGLFPFSLMLTEKLKKQEIDFTDFSVLSN